MEIKHQQSTVDDIRGWLQEKPRQKQNKRTKQNNSSRHQEQARYPPRLTRHLSYDRKEKKNKTAETTRDSKGKYIHAWLIGS